MRDDNAGAFEAARKLSEAGARDPVALWAYLHALGARGLALGVRYGVREAGMEEENVAPLERPEVDHVIACFASCEPAAPSWPRARSF